MDTQIYLAIIAIVLLILVPFVLLISSVIRVRKKNTVVNEKKTQLKNLYKHETVYLCDGIDDLGENLIQFYGEPFGISVRPGMKILVNGTEYTIKEVYADDETHDGPDSEIPNGMPNTAIVIESSSFNWGNLKQRLRQEGVIALKLY
jgi:hypothetical protein